MGKVKIGLVGIATRRLLLPAIVGLFVWVSSAFCNENEIKPRSYFELVKGGAGISWQGKRYGAFADLSAFEMGLFWDKICISGSVVNSRIMEGKNPPLPGEGWNVLFPLTIRYLRHTSKYLLIHWYFTLTPWELKGSIFNNFEGGLDFCIPGFEIFPLHCKTGFAVENLLNKEFNENSGGRASYIFLNVSLAIGRWFIGEVPTREPQIVQQSVYKDSIPPEISIISPIPTRGIAVVAEASCEVIGLAKDESKVVSVVVGAQESALEPISGGVKFKAQVPLKSYENEIIIKASDEYGNVETKLLTINRKEEKVELTTPPGEVPLKTELWVLSIGVSNYENPNIRLLYADEDAYSIAQCLEKQEGKLFSEVHYKTVTNEKATRENIIENMRTFLGKASHNDMVLIFLAGHGVKDKQTGSYYFLPYDAKPDNLMARGLLWATFNEAITRISQNVSKVLLFLDTCHAGAMQIAMRGVEAGEDLAGILAKAEGTYVLASSKAGEESEESARFKITSQDRGHGAFTYAILKGLKGEADFNSDNKITLMELFQYVSDRVPKITNGAQHPYFQMSGTDMPIYVK